MLHLTDAVFDQLLFVGVDVQPPQNVLVALNELGGGEPGTDARQLGVVLDDMADGVDTAVDGAGVAEIAHRRGNPLFGHGQGLHNEFVDALILGGADGDHGDAQPFGQLLGVDGAAVAADLVHHVQGQHRGNAHFQQLQGKIQIPFQVGAIHNVDDAVGLLVEDEVPGHDFLGGVGPQGVDARQVHHFHVFLATDGAGFLVHGDAGEVAHVLIGAGELVEQCGLAAILIADQCENHWAASFCSTVMLAASALRSVSS